MIIKVNERIYIQTRNILTVNDRPEENAIDMYFNTSTQMFSSCHRYSGQDRKDVLRALDLADELQRD